TNRLGQPTGYVLHAEQNPTLLADPSSSIASRAAFTTKQLWVSQYSPDERYPAGEFVNQNPGGDGLPAYLSGDRSLDGGIALVGGVLRDPELLGREGRTRG
ncbi:hypothetical protein ACC691_37955, partial [Rhizobium johnstonii]|uniref:copper amine oxidase n=1 Tax=Rhizobium johnstonii TaxID=3019933 RepID=UPI003F979FCD